MAIGARPIGTRGIGDNTNQVLPAVVTVVGLIYLSAMPGSYTPGGGTPAVIAGGGGASVSSTDTAVGSEAQSLTVALVVTEAGAAAEGQSLAVAQNAAETGSGAEAQSLAVTRSSSDAAVGTETESVFIPAPPTTYAFASIFENLIFNPAELTAFAMIYENAVDAPPIPHIWYVTPPAANRGETVTVVGYGFGESAVEFEGYVALNSQTPPIEDWRRIVASPNALTLDRIINSLNDTSDPEHERIDFKIPMNATSGDVEVVLNAEGV